MGTYELSEAYNRTGYGIATAEFRVQPLAGSDRQVNAYGNQDRR
jgi:hypothetical protein